METTAAYDRPFSCIGIMENKMETTIVYYTPFFPAPTCSRSHRLGGGGGVV